MTTTTPAGSATAYSDDRRTSIVVGLVAFAVAAAFTLSNAHGLSESVIVLTGAAVIAAVVYGWVVPRGMTTGMPGTALTLSVLAVLLLLPGFWTTLPLLLGLAGALLGHSSIAHAPKRSYAAVGLGALAAAGYLFLYLVVDLFMGGL